MKIRQKLLLAASGISLLVAAAGGIGWYAKDQTLYLSNIRHAGNKLLTLKIRERANLRHYLQSSDPDHLASLEKIHHHIHDDLMVWRDALKFGTDSAEFKKRQDSYTLWQDKQRTSSGLNMTIPYNPKLAKFLKDFEGTDHDFQALEMKAMAVHRELLKEESVINSLYPREKELRYNLKDAVSKLNDPILNESIGLTFYYSKESLFQYKDKKHRDLWLNQIDLLAKQLAAFEEKRDLPAGFDLIKTSLADYRNIADQLSSLAIKLSDLNVREKASLESFDILIQEFLINWQAEYQNTVHNLTVQEQSRINIFLSVATIAGCLIALLAAFVLAEYFSRPLVDLRNLATEVGQGNLDVKASVRSDDEIGHLAKAFNQMTSDLHASVISISRLNDEVNERKAAQEQSQKAYRTLETILSNMPFGVMVVGKDRKIRRINPAAESILGLSEGEAVGRMCHQFVCPAERDACPILDLKQTVDSSERSILTADGKRLPVIKTVLPVTLDNEEVLLEAFVDISARKAMEEKLRQANDELEMTNEQLSLERDKAESANMAKSIFLSNVSHEIRTPMNGLIGMSEVLCRTNLDEKQKRYTEQLKSSAMALSSVLNDILDFSKIGSGKLDLIEEDIDFWKFMESLSDSWSQQAGRKGIGFHLILPPEIPRHLRCDRHHLQLLLNHIVNNAVKFTREGYVRIHVDAEPVGNDAITLRFDVEDTGIGIPEDKQDVMFKPFSQVDGSSTRQHGGTGLGLAIVKHVSERMGGTVTYESTLGAGTIFNFSVTVGRGSPTSSEPLFGDSPVTVYVLSDNLHENDFLKTTLSRWGLNSLCCKDSDELITELKKNESSLVLFSDAYTSELNQELNREDIAIPDGRVIQISNSDSSKTLSENTPRLLRPLNFRELQTAIAESLDVTMPNDETLDDGQTLTTQKTWSHYNILLVEDHRVNQQVAVSMLTKHGLNIDLASNGMEALDALRTRQYDCVFMDCQMPGMDGIETTKQIRNNTESPVLNRAVPVIALTASATERSKADCLEAGMDDYLTKPISQKELGKVLAKWLPAGSARRTSTITAHTVAQNCGKNVSAPDIFDSNELLNRVLGDYDAMVSIMKIFIEDTPKLIDDIALAVKESRFDDVRRLAHMLKGSSGNLAGKQVHQLAMKIEEAAKIPDAPLLSSETDKLKEAFSALKTCMAETLSSSA